MKASVQSCVAEQDFDNHRALLTTHFFFVNMHTCIPICGDFKWKHTHTHTHCLSIEHAHMYARRTRWIFHVLNNRAGTALKAVTEDQETKLWSMCSDREQGQDEQELLCTSGGDKKGRVQESGLVGWWSCLTVFVGVRSCKWGTMKQGHRNKKKRGGERE